MGHHSPRAKRHLNDDDPSLNAGLVALSFLGDPDQYCKKNLCFRDFSGVIWTPCPSSGSAHGPSDLSGLGQKAEACARDMNNLNKTQVCWF